MVKVKVCLVQAFEEAFHYGQLIKEDYLVKEPDNRIARRTIIERIHSYMRMDLPGTRLTPEQTKQYARTRHANHAIDQGLDRAEEAERVIQQEIDAINEKLTSRSYKNEHEKEILEAQMAGYKCFLESEHSGIEPEYIELEA